MGRGSKIYHRFGLKWALAYRYKKLKRKIKNNTPLWLQKTLMFCRILKLKNANKFKIYKILIQCHYRQAKTFRIYCWTLWGDKLLA